MTNRENRDAEIMEELRFIEERDKLDEEMQWSFEKYTEHYELIRAYGLDLKLINELEWFIVLELEHNREEFLKYHSIKSLKIMKRLNGLLIEFLIEPGWYQVFETELME